MSHRSKHPRLTVSPATTAPTGMGASMSHMSSALNKAPAPGSENPSKALAELTSLSQSIASFKTDLTCKICMRYLYEPFTAHCGHTFCYSCLSQWFNDKSTCKKKQTCPTCRIHISQSPAPAYLVRDLVHKIIEQIAFLDDGETVEQHQQWQQEETQIVEQDRTNTDPHTGGLFKGRFKHRATDPVAHAHIIRDAEDGVDRCPICTWEIERGEDTCAGCGTTFGNSDSEMSDYESDEDGQSIDDMLRHVEDLSEDDDDGDLMLEDAEFDADMEARLDADFAAGIERARRRESQAGANGRQHLPTASPNPRSEAETNTTRDDASITSSHSTSEANEDDFDEEDDVSMEGFIDDDLGSEKSQNTETAPSSSPVQAKQRVRRGNPYIVESSSSSAESSEDEDRVVSSTRTRRSVSGRSHTRSTTTRDDTDDTDDSEESDESH